MSVKRGTVILFIWLIVGALAAGQRGYFSLNNVGCSQGATMAEVKGSRLEFNDRIKMTPKHAFWTFDTSGHSDGFDFRTSGAGQCVRFNLQGPASTNVFIGSKQYSPGTKHFELCP
mgnify:CR=1 FL=1